MMEIERKFFVNLDLIGTRLQSYPSVFIRQAYLAVDEVFKREVRIRDKGGTCTVTIKEGMGLVRKEIETALSKEQFDALIVGAQGRIIEKTRYELPIGDYTAEVDIFQGCLDGLALVEVEFSSEDEAKAFQCPQWFGEEKTADARFKNVQLATARTPLQICNSTGL